MPLESLRLVTLLAAATLSACQSDAEDPARLWSGQTAEAVRIAGRAHSAPVQGALPASSAQR